MLTSGDLRTLEEHVFAPVRDRDAASPLLPLLIGPGPSGTAPSRSRPRSRCSTCGAPEVSPGPCWYCTPRCSPAWLEHARPSIVLKNARGEVCQVDPSPNPFGGVPFETAAARLADTFRTANRSLASAILDNVPPAAPNPGRTTYL
jgi:hypothetical protein